MTGSKSLTLLPEEDKNRRKGLVGSIILHLLLLLLLLLPFIRFPIPPPGQQGILVSFGVPDQGQNDDRPDTQNKEQVTPTPPVTESKPVEKPVAPQASAADRKVLTTDEAQDVTIRKAKEAETKRLQEETQRRREAEEAQRRADEEARKKAEEEARKKAEYEQSKKQFGTLLSGSGRGETGTPGNQGSPDGDPNASNLKGVSTGSGRVEGLGGRGVKYTPTIKDNSQVAGRVAVDICVDRSGKVISAKYTQHGSTITDSNLRALAEESARKFVFTESETEKQCGKIIVDFKIQ